MALSVRTMTGDESHIVPDYFHGSTPEHLDGLGIDPSRLPNRSAWQKMFDFEMGLPPPERSRLFVTWLLDSEPIGFSTSDTHVFGDRAHMHLHILHPENRGRGIGTECLRRTIAIYFDTLCLKQLLCEPNAYNVAPNRALQKSGFSYVKTHMTVPGSLGYRQPVTRWVLEDAARREWR